MDSHEKKISFKDTLNLPRTDFPIRANPKVDDPELIQRWQQENLFKKSFDHNKGNESFILHDGPPYSNGHIHIGHAYNKVLKDISAKSQRMLGKHAPIMPGWDNHGLPIEQKVSQEHPNLDSIELKKACRAYAQKWVDIQREEFKNLGVLMDWDNPYLTMSTSYEASILKAFGNFVADGYIERKNKTVPWCPHDRTVLATAEIEYEERKDPSLFVLFQLDSGVIPTIYPSLGDSTVNLLVWTTTPWTLPLNRAVLMRPETAYVIAQMNGNFYMVAKELLEKVAALIDAQPKIIQEFMSADLLAAHPKVLHPFIPDLKVPLLGDASVLIEQGTAFVHCAPGCGPEDYDVGIRNNLEIFSPISPDGKYTYGIAPQELEGMAIADGQIWVIKKLAELNRIFYKTTIKHSYPHCWRCHNPLIFRATRQWFCDLSKSGLKQRAVDATDTIATIPEKSINRLRSTIEGRLEWCLSRQRVWGVPIPALLCSKCDYTYITQGLIERVVEGVAQEGIEFWDRITAQELVPKGFACPVCKGESFKKETDILDVWFESGISHYAVLLTNPELRFPADMYLEGSDQHRAWFQSSLLTALVLEKKAPMNMIFTHGFVVDGNGRKMSKSLGNVVAPQDIINQYGTDGLRLWVSSLDCSGDAVVSDALLKNVGQVLNKIRNTCRFLVSNLYDFDIEKDEVPLIELRAIDQYALHKLYCTQACILQNYKNFDFTAIFHQISDYCSVDLSAFYLDIIKDRLYVERADGIKRRSAQTACWYILDALTKLIAPILSFTAEQVSDHYQRTKKSSIHLQNFANIDACKDLVSADDEAVWAKLKEIRSAVLKAIEILREQGVVKLPLETRVTLHFDKELNDLIQPIYTYGDRSLDITQFLKEFFIVSQVELAASGQGLQSTSVTGLSLHVMPARGSKCPRCWQYDEVHNEQGLCRRCQEVLR